MLQITVIVVLKWEILHKVKQVRGCNQSYFTNANIYKKFDLSHNKLTVNYSFDEVI